MSLKSKIQGLFKDNITQPTCQFEVKVGSVSYKAQGTSVSECKDEVLDVMRQIKPAPIDYIQ